MLFLLCLDTHTYTHKHNHQSWEPAHKALPSMRFASASKDKTISVWDVATRRPQFTMSNHTMVRALWFQHGELSSGNTY